MPRIRGWYFRAAVMLLGTTALTMGTHAGPPVTVRGGRCVTPQYCPPPYTKDAPPSEQPGRPTDPGTVPKVEGAKPVDPNAPVPPPPDGAQAPQQQQPNQQDQAQQQQQQQQNLNIPPANQNLATSSSSGAQSVAPGMIGDFFGTAGSQNILITPGDITHGFAGYFRNPITGNNVQFTAANLGGPGTTILLTTPDPLIVNGEVPGVPVGVTSFDSTDTASPPFPGSFSLDENTSVTSAIITAHPSAVGVIFNGGQADTDAGDSSLYNVYQDYTIVDALAGSVPAFFIFVPGNNLAAAPGGNVGRMKLAENTSPIPRDRVFVNYSYFNNTPLGGSVDVNRVTPGFEKTFFNGNCSVELRTPFATTLSSDINGGVLNTDEAEFGNLTVYMKALLYANCTTALSAGLGITAPTADDFRVRDAAGTNLMMVDNKSVHLLPFVGGVYTPNDRLFAQTIVQFDVDPNGNPVSVTGFNAAGPTGVMTQIGRPHDFTYMFFDTSVGYWVYRDRCGRGFITGVAPMIEYHWNQSLGNGDSTRGVVNGVVYNFNAPEGISTHNAVLGLTSIIRDNATLTAGYAVPLVNEDSQFDGEFRLMFNWLFGKSRPTTRLMRASTF